MTFEFQTPWFALLFLPLLGGLWAALHRRPPALLVPETTGLEAAGGRPAQKLGATAIPILLYGLGTAVLIVALMRPRTGTERIIEHHEGIDIVLLLDVSGSMESYDIPQGLDTQTAMTAAITSGKIKQRIEVAKQELRRFVEHRPNDRIALTAFARKPYLVCPPTLDHQFLTEQLARLEAGMLPDGTGIAAALASAVNRLKESSARRKVCVLFTDGKDNIQDRMTPRQAAQAARDQGIIAHTVGVGSDRAMMRITNVLSTQLQPIPKSLDTALLEDVAKRTGGRAFHAEDETAFAAAMKEIDVLETVPLERTICVDYRERFMPWLVGGLLLLLAGALLGNTCYQRVP